MQRFLVLFLLAVVVLSACIPVANDQQNDVEDTSTLVTVYRSPTWGCCGDWSEYIQENGFTVQINDDKDRAAIRNQFAVPEKIQSCHTAIVDGYIIEGHVPVAEIDRLLSERPDVVGLAVLGMPAGSPGMEDVNVAEANYDVISFDKNGNTTIFASYP